MFKNVTVVFFLACTIFLGQGWSQEINDCTSAGRAALFDGTVSGLRAAHEIFSLKLEDEDCSDDRELIFLQAITRIAMWAFRDDGLPIDSAVEFGSENNVKLVNDYYGALDLLAGEDFFPVNEHDSYDIPEDGESVLSDLFEFMTRAGVSEIESVIDELDRIQETPEDRFRMFLTPQETAMFFGLLDPILADDIEVDYGEVLLLKGALSAIRAILLSKAAYDLYVDDEDMLIEKLVGGCFSINNDLLLPHPDFLKLLPTSNDPNDGAEALMQARASYIDAINDYLEAIDYILSEDDPAGSDPQSDELLFIYGSGLTTIEALEVNLRMLLNSLENDETGTYIYETIQSYSLQADGATAIGTMELVFDAWKAGKGGSIDLQYCGYTPSEWKISELYIEDGMVYADMESWTSDLGNEFLQNLDSARSVLFTPVNCPGVVPYDCEILDTCLFEATGSAQGWKGRNRSWSYTLPFEFPFYGTTYNSVYVSTDGFIDFADSDYRHYYFPDRIRIQPCGTYLRTDTAGDYDIYVDTAENEVKIRWKGDYYGAEFNFSVTLFRDGQIRFDYGPHNTGSWPEVGISNGNGSTAIQFRDSFFYGFFSGTLAEGGSSITEGVLDFWGDRSGRIENISADLVNTVTLNQVADVNPILGSSVRYPDPVSPRDLLPEFDAWSAPLPDTLGNGLGQDATLGGILPEMTQEQWRMGLELEPAANLDWQAVEPEQLADGWVGSWTVEQLVINDYEGDIPDRYAGIGGLDIHTLHMGIGHDPNYLYGSIALYDSMLPDGHYGFGVGLSRDPYDQDALDAVEVSIRIEAGAIQAQLLHNTGYNEWEEMKIGAVEVMSYGNRLDFRVPLDLMSDYLDGRFVSVTSEWNWSDADENQTHIRMGQVGTVSGTVAYANYNGAPIFVQAYLDPGDPEDSIISATMITEPGPYVLEGIGDDWTGYVRAFTPLFGFNILDIDALAIEESVIAVMSGASAEDVNIVLNDPPVLEPDVTVADQIDTELDRWDIYAFDALKGASYTLLLTRQTADNAWMILLARNGDDELAETGSQPLDWQCERTGTYYVKVEEFSWQPTGGTYQILLTADPVSFADPNLKAAVEAELGITDPTPMDMLNLVSLNAYEMGISDLTGLEYALNLQNLDLGYNMIDDISPLSGLTNLTSLSLERNLMSDISPLSGLMSLQSLNLSYNLISNISPLSGLVNLSYVDLAHNLISGIFPLTKLSQLRELYLAGNSLSQASHCLFLPQIIANNPFLTELSSPTNPYDCDGPVVFTDANLKAAVEQALGITDPNAPDMLALTSLTAENRGIADLTGLEYAANLTDLSLEKNQISDISPLAGLTNLTSLHLGTNQISDISAVAGLTNLTGLWLHQNQISDISPLAGLTNLTALLLDQNQISDISAVAGLTDLTHLYLNSNLISDISPLSKLTKLQQLSLAENQISDICSLLELVNLRWLYLQNNEITDLLCLARLTNLERLYLNGNQISDISALAGLTNLTRLYLYANQITDISPLAGHTNLTSLHVESNPLDEASYCTYLPQIRANNTDIDLSYDEAGDVPCDVEGRIYVDSAAPLGGDGSTWLRAYKYVQDAMAAAEPNSRIWVAQGVYKPDQGGGNSPGDRAATFRLSNGMAIYGGFPSGGDWDDRNPQNYETILSGDLAGDDDSIIEPLAYPDDPYRAENSYHVVTVTDTDASAVLDGFVITAGNSPNSGGGIYGYPSAGVTIRNSVIRNNSAYNGGGLADCNGSITNCVIRDNLANSGNGGGLYRCNGLLEQCTVTFNVADTGGGLFQCHGQILESSINNNLATFYYGYGGGLRECDAVLRGCTISGNRADGEVVSYGGGLSRCNGAIVDCVISGNYADFGGGSSFCEGPFINCTIVGNMTQWPWRADAGSGIRGTDGAILNCIIWENRPTSSQVSISTTPTYCLVQDGCAGIGCLDVAPDFAVSGYWDDNGTPGDPNNDFWVDGDYHLQAGSPAINAGDPNYLAPETKIVIDEQHTFTDPFDVELNEANIDIASIVLTDATGTEIYQQGDDYTVVEVDGEISLNITPLGVVLPNITDGQQLYVDYTYTFDPAEGATDLDGNPRIVHGRVDMGAYEKQSIFVDANLKAAIEAALGVTNPSPADMLNLTLLDAENRNIVDLAGIGYAVNITSLALDDNQIAELPPEIGNLTKLEFLDLSGNQLTTLPAEIGNLSNLQILYLDGNQLTVLPAEIGNLTSLNHLFLTNNQLGVVPAEIGNLTNLNSLWLDENFLSVLPEEIWTLTELRTLAVDNNLLTSLPPQIGDLTKLENLFLDGNQLTSLPEELWTLTGLRGLSLGPNPLPTVLPTELWNLTNLVMLDLTGFQLDTLPPQIANLTELRELHLGDNQITDVSILADLATLERLDLTGNQVVDISPLVSLTQLQELDLTQNPLNDAAYCQYLPLIRAKNPGIDLQYDEAEDLPCDVEGRIYVDSNAPLGGVGSTWLSAFKYLREALAAAEEGNQIWVVQGVYRPDQGSGAAPGDRTATFQLKNGVAVYGGFPIGGDWTSRDPETYETILSGDLAGDDQLVEDPADLPAEPTRGENSLHVVTGSGTDETAVLDGFIIEGGNANGAEVNDNGGGMNNEGGSPTVMNCVFRNNSADMGGAGMFNASSSPTITNCEFTNNCALEYGGGMNNHTDSNPHVTDCRFNYNKAVNGGGMLNSYNSDPIIEDCVFTYNDAEDAGGAVVNVYDSDPEFIHCIFERNSALQGAGMLNVNNSNPALTNCTFRENTAREDAGAIDNGEASSPLIISCNFIGNQAADEGGAVQNDSSQPTFINCIFAGNKAMYAGAIKNETEGQSPCVATFVNCTFTGNRATSDAAISSGDSTVILRNCILWDDEPSEIDTFNSTLTVTYSNVQGSWPGVGNIDLDPLLVDPGRWDDNGTPADIGDDIWIDGDYHLKSRAGHWDPVGKVWVKDSVNSPCIDAGDPADDIANEALPNGDIINMGIYGGSNEASLSAELVPVVYVKSDATGNNNGTTWADAFTALQDALLYVELRSDTLIEIWVAAGVYRPDTGSQQIPRHRGSTFHLVSNAEIYGGFDGTESRLDERNPQANTTFLSGDLNGDDGQGNYTDNSYHVVTASGTSNQAVLDGFVISDGNADMPGMKGAGIICLSGGATIRNCTLQDNQATCATAIDCRDSLLSLEDCTILSNSAPSGCHVAFSQSLVSIQGVVSVSDGQVNVFGGRFFGAGVLEIQSTADMVINSSETCSVKNITNIWGAEMDPTTIYLSPYGNWPGQWWVPGVSLRNAVVLGEDTTWCIAPDFAAESAVLLWYGNELGYDMSFAGTAEARFDAGGELFIYGELYDITDAGTDRLYEGLLLWAHVDRFHIRENLVQTDQLDMLSSIEIMPLGGFLAINDVGMRMSGVQLLNLSLGHCQQRGGPVINFQNDIETTSTSELSFITAELPQAVTVVSCGVIGAGDIDIQAGSELQLDGGMIRLLDTGNSQGKVTVDGKLVAMDGGFVKDSQIKVNSASFIQGSEAHYNSVGGDFFVSGAAYISGNTIEAEGDRYMNVDLTNPRQPTIGSNAIKVTIPPEETSEQGTLLELRAADDDCDTATNPQCRSGARQVTIGDRFAGAPAGNWVLDILHLEPHARLNLTNRRGFEFNAADGREVLYVKELILGPDSVLNTALQTLYYETLILIAEDGSETIWAGGAPYPESFPNRSRIIDIPLLGFSLKVIDMDDLTQSPNNEFDIRVDYRLTDEADRDVVGHGLPLPRGSILLLQNARDTGDGVMEMSTKGPDTVSAASIAAKGAFVRAGDEDITIEFEYMFFEDSGDAEIVVYLSDHPTVGESLVEVARISPPAPGRPGAIGSSRYGLFSGVFPRGDLNFTRGTYVELELRGRDARCWIDNWDPAIRCGVVCGDYGGWYYGVSDIEDYLLLLSEFGLSWPVSVNKGCLDLINDGVINVNDLMAWNIEGMLNVCPTQSGDGLYDMSSNKAHVSTKSYTGPKIGIFEPLVVFGKPAANANGADLVPEDYLYSAHADGTVIESATAGTSGRLITDTNGQVYQIQGNGSLVHQSTGSIVFGPKQGVVYGSSTVSIGFIGGQTVPVLDAAFSPNDPDVVYVLPVLVTPSAGATPYKAAAKLALSGNLNDPNYSVEMIYGMDPNTDPTVTITSESSGTILLEPDVQHLSEIEVDSDGNLYILSAHGYTDNKWVLMYDEQIGNPSETRISLSQFNIANPAAMLVSSNKEKLYLTSCANESADLATEVYRFSIVRQGNDPNLALAEVITVNCPDPNVCGALPAFCAGGSYVATITAMAEDPDDGTVYATGFTAPKFDTNLTELPPEIKERGIYTTAMLAKIPIDTAGPVDAREFKNTTGAPIVLPMSIAWTGGKLPKCSGADISGNGDVDMEDFAILVSQWFSTSGSLSADIAPERYYDETVDILDLATLATYWLHTDCK